MPDSFTRNLSPRAQALLRNIFNDSPASEATGYLDSIAFESRRASRRDERLGMVDFEPPYLPGWMATGPAYGPYERTTFRDIMCGPNNVAIFQGGTGSGKSSIVRQFMGWCNERSAEFRNGLDNFPCEVFSILLDMQTVADRIHLLDERDASEKILEDLANKLRSGFLTVMKDCSAALAILLAIRDEARTAFGRVPAAELNDAVFQLKQALQQIGFDKLPADPEGRFFAFSKAIESLPNRLQQVFLWLLPFCHISRIAYSVARDKRVVLLLDNLDRISARLQHVIYSALDTLFKSNNLYDCGLRIVLVMRLSSALDPKAAFTNFEVIPHCSPDPGEVVFYRCTQALLDGIDDNSQTFHLLPVSEKTILLARLFLLWENLLDKNSAFARCFSSLAGSNIRNAFEYAKRWVSCDELFGPRAKLDNVTAARFSNVVQRYVSEHVCVVFGLAVTTALTHQYFVQRYSANDVDSFVTNETERIAGTVIQILESCGLLQTGKSGSSRPRQLVGRIAIDTLRKRVEKGENLDQRSDHPYLASCIEQVLEWTMYSEEQDAVAQAARQIFAGIGGTAAAIYKSRCQARGEEVDETIVKKMNGLSKVASELLTDGATVEIEDERKTTNRGMFELGGMKLDPDRNDFEMCTLLFQPSDDATAVPVNVFSVDRQSASAAILRILYLAWERDINHGPEFKFNGPLEVQHILTDAREYDYESELVGAMQVLMNPQSRLLYSRALDSDESTSVLDKRGLPLKLTWGGRSYVEHLCTNTVYIQWALSNVAQLRASDANEHVYPEVRFEFVLKCFRELINAEIQCLTKKYESINATDVTERQRKLRTTEMYLQGAVCDVFFRSTLNFFSDMRRSLRAQEKHRSVVSSRVASKHVQILREWCGCCDSFIDKYRGICGAINTSWQRIRDACYADFKQIGKS
ncbi:MAG: hypothetical protein U0941_13330 [Planctomycetaceae bacterium]